MNTLRISALLGALTVIAGAFGAHALSAHLTDAELEVYKTAVFYQFIHVLALLLIASLKGVISQNKFKAISYCFLTGVLLFSGSLYAITCCKVMKTAVPIWLGPITPLGGLSFITGWVLLAVAAGKSIK